MTHEKDEDFPQIKRELIEEVKKTREFIAEGNEQRAKYIAVLERLERKVYGDPKAEPPLPGLDSRVKELEEIEAGREDAKKGIIGLAFSSFAIALGGVLFWIGAALKEYFVKGP